jgi:HD-like signal output (HDOD) protein
MKAIDCLPAMIATPPIVAPGKLTPDDIVRDLQNLPSAPKVLPRLKILLSDGNSSMAEVVKLIRLDPGIAARVLRMGNSAYYSHGARCFTVDDAVNRVGYSQVYELVSYAVASQVLVRPLAVYGLEADQLWQMSVSCAIAAEALASRTGQDCDVAYTVGLLHGLGMVGIDEWTRRERPGLTLANKGFPREAIEAERTAFGFTQADTGAALLRHWDFPMQMCEPVRWQYAPRSSAGHVRMACLLHVAKWIRSAVCAGNGEIPSAPAEAALYMLPIRANELPQIVAEVKQRMSDVSSLLEVDGLCPRDMLQFPSDNLRTEPRPAVAL